MPNKMRKPRAVRRAIRSARRPAANRQDDKMEQDYHVNPENLINPVKLMAVHRMNRIHK